MEKRIENQCPKCACYYDNWDQDEMENIEIDSDCTHELNILSREKCPCFSEVFEDHSGDNEVKYCRDSFRR